MGTHLGRLCRTKGCLVRRLISLCRTGLGGLGRVAEYIRDACDKEPRRLAVTRPDVLLVDGIDAEPELGVAHRTDVTLQPLELGKIARHQHQTVGLQCHHDEIELVLDSKQGERVHSSGFSKELP